jgi:hypothetical protein
MSMEFPETFRPEEEEGNTWDLIPPGEYVAEAIEAKVAPPKSGIGYGMTLTWKIQEGDYEGRQIWQYITFSHSSEAAQAIGRKQIKDLCTAFGISEHVESAEPFLFKPARIRVGVKKDDQGLYDDQNKVSRVLPLTEAAKPAAGSEAAKPEKPAAAQRTARPGPAGTAPWHAKR